MRVLVLGGHGFLGRHIVQALARQGHHAVVGTRSPLPPGHVPRQAGTEEIAADLDVPDSLTRAMETVGPEAVVNCAAYGLDPGMRDPVAAIRTNALGAVAAFRAAEGCGIRRFIHFGTCFEFGSQDAPVDESSALRPQGIYATSKASASLILEDLARESAVAAVLLRPFVMVGPGERPTKLVPQILASARARVPLLLTEGREVRDYVDAAFVAEAAAGLLSVEEAAFPRAQSFCLCSGEPRTVRQFVEGLAAALGASDLLRFGARLSRTDVPACVVGRPDRWRTFARGLPRHLPIESRPLSEVFRDLASGAAA